MSEELKNEQAGAEEPVGKEKVKQSLFERAMSFLGLEDIGSRKKLDSLRVDSNERLQWEMAQAIDVAGDVIQEKADTVVADDQERTAKVIDIATKREIKNPELQSKVDAIKQKQEEMASKLATIRAEFTAKAKAETSSETKKSRDEIRVSKEYQAFARQFNSANEKARAYLMKDAIKRSQSSEADTDTINAYRLFEADARKAKDGQIDVPKATPVISEITPRASDKYKVVKATKETDPRPSDKYKVVKTEKNIEEASAKQAKERIDNDEKLTAYLEEAGDKSKAKLISDRNDGIMTKALLMQMTKRPEATKDEMRQHLESVRDFKVANGAGKTDLDRAINWALRHRFDRISEQLNPATTAEEPKEQLVASPDSARAAAAMDVMPKEADLEAVQAEANKEEPVTTADSTRAAANMEPLPKEADLEAVQADAEEETLKKAA
ncbi:MAG: hypothetical protein ABIH67_03155 [Candidatus Uhrbacteria bacterium]